MSPMAFEEFPFNGDRLMELEVLRLIEDYNIQSIVETGTYHGVTTEWFAKTGLPVDSIEVRMSFAQIAREQLKHYLNVQVHVGTSDRLLQTLIPSLRRPTLYFLDAHWSRNWPLHGELEWMAKYGCSDSVIVIHDFRVPGTDLGYDEYEGQALDWDYVAKHIEAVYPQGFTKWTNPEAEGARRGVLYVAPNSC